MLELAQKALARWPVEVQAIELAARRENAVFKVNTPGGDFALRLHRKGYRSDAELTSELQWMAELARGGLSVPEPLASLSGAFIELIEGVQVDVLGWLSGVPMGVTGTPLALADRAGTFLRLGQTMAKLHTLSDGWTLPAGFTRPRWDLDGLLGEAPLWGRFWENPMLGSAQQAMLRAVRQKAWAALQEPGDADFGLVHADMVRENVLVDGDAIRLIDFDDSGFGFRLFDMATALIKNRSEPDYAELEAALIGGYRTVRVLDSSALPLFMALRGLTYLGWISARFDEPGGRERCARHIASYVPLAEEWLEA